MARGSVSQVFDLESGACNTAAILASNEGLLTRFERPRAYRFGSWEARVDPLKSGAPASEELWALFGLRTRPCSRVSIWFDRITGTVQSTPPPLLRVELRAGVGAEVSTSAAIRTATIPAWGAAGELVFQFSGILATQWELWAGTLDNGPGAPAQSVRVQWVVEIDSSACCQRTIVDGPWV